MRILERGTPGDLEDVGEVVARLREREFSRLDEAAFGRCGDVVDRCLDSFEPGAFTPRTFSACLGGEPVGAIRASMGIANTAQDIDRMGCVVDMLRAEASAVSTAH